MAYTRDYQSVSALTTDVDFQLKFACTCSF